MSSKSTLIHDDHDYLDQDYTTVAIAAPAAEHAHLQVADAAAYGGPGVGGSGGGPGVGGDGGGSRLVTTYTSGDPNVNDANEFNIQINFEGKWTPQQQAVV